MGRVRVDGKQFAVDDGRFPFHGVTYGTFRPRGDGARFPEFDRAKQDFAAMNEAGFTVIRTYTAPPPDVVDLAYEWGLRVLAGVFYPDWRYLLGTSRRDRGRVTREARAEVRATARRLTGNEAVLGLAIGNEIPADVVRWVGTKEIAGVISELAEVVRDEDPELLVTYANYPTAEYLPLECLDFRTFNVFLERREDFRRYLTRLHHLAGDRPLVLGEVGLHAGTTEEGERRQAEVVGWQLETAMERGVGGTCLFSWTDEWWVGEAPVEGWNFGLTRADRSPRAALHVAQAWNRRTVADLREEWPLMSVVICAYNARATLDECLRHTCALDYPNLEIIVVDDGSADDTAAIASRHARVRLATIDHAGLSVARNEGYRLATGDLIAYLDSDAYPSPEWPYYLALGMDGPMVGGVGGPNVSPPTDPPGAHQVAQAPGGPVHVLLTDDRAEHVPGCNMAFWKQVLVEVGGFDPVYTAAGDDVDFCWRVLDRGWEIGFHPAALVWHHRRPGLRTYLKQQRGYGKAEALVEARHPDRFTTAGTARWSGRIYSSAVPSFGRQRVYRGLYGAAAYQSVYRRGGHGLDLAHQAGVPLAFLLLLTSPLAVLSAELGVPALVGLAAVICLGAVDVVQARSQRGGRGWAFSAGVATLHLLQPLVRTWGRLRHRDNARRDLVQPGPLPSPALRLRWNTLVFHEDRPRAELAANIIGHLRRAGFRVLPSSGWEDHDARLMASCLVKGDLITSSHPEGWVQARIRCRPRWVRAGLVVAVSVGSTMMSPAAAATLVAAGTGEALRGMWRTGPLIRRMFGDGKEVAHRPARGVG